ncbi:hypothetical protein GCM10027300_30130 [Modestobacter lapidis]
MGARYRALPVHWPTRIRLRLHARADRRAGLPLGMDAGTTPVLQDLLARHGDACERERTRYLADVEPLTVELGRLEAELTRARTTVATGRLEHARTAVPPTEAQLARRLAGEQGLPEALVRQRRQTEHDRRVAAAQTAVDEAQQAVDAALARRAQLEARRRHRAEIARSRVLRYGEFIRRQAAIYRRALARRHPDHEALVHQWRDDLFPPPAWAGTDVLVPSSREAGVAA